jgi:hypothetical protein
VNTETEFEAWVRSELVVIAERVTPRPDPYGRLLRRRGLGWLRRGLLATVVAVATAATVTAVALAPAGPRPSPGPDNAMAWVDTLVDGPPRGALAGDAPFRRDLQVLVTDILYTGEYQEDLQAIDGRPHVDQEVRLIFADDVDQRRIAILALRLPEPPDRNDPLVLGPGRTRVVWLVGPRGASAHQLASALTTNPMADVSAGADNAAPLIIARAGDPGSRAPGPRPAINWIGLAPPGCTVLSAAAADPDVWTPEPTGSYIVRTPDTYRAEYWRVSCAGVIREERPVPWSSTGISTEELIAPAVADLDASALNLEDFRTSIEMGVNTLANQLGGFLAGPPRVRYAGRPPGVVVEAPDQNTVLSSGVVLLVAPTATGTWACLFLVFSSYGSLVSTNHVTVITTADPFLPGAAVAASVDYGTTPPHVLAAVPPAAVTAQLLAPTGVVLATSGVVDGLAVLTLPEAYTTTDATGKPTPVQGLRVIASDAAGSPVSSTEVLSQGVEAVSGVHSDTTTWD